MENNQSKGILVSDTQLTDIIDKYEFLMLHLNTQITPTINKHIDYKSSKYWKEFDSSKSNNWELNKSNFKWKNW